MKKAEVKFIVLEDTTTVIATGLTGNVDVINITGTEAEKKFISLVKDLQEHQLTNEILQAIDINNWQEGI